MESITLDASHPRIGPAPAAHARPAGGIIVLIGLALLPGGCEVFLSEKGSEGHACLPGERPCASGLICEAGVCQPGCRQDAECDDGDPCTDDVCSGGLCSNPPLADGIACDDGLYCTVADQCLAGVCTGGPRDCSNQAGVCQRGVCDEGQDRCSAENLPDGSGCDDGRWCTVDDACAGGQCGGAARDCSELDGVCHHGWCDEANLRCAVADDEDGAACDDGDPCTMDDACLSGQCHGIDKDSDGDGFLDATCGGVDCDDGDAAVHPFASENESAAGSCADGADNDCDGCTDMQDSGCGGPPALCWIAIPGGTFTMGSDAQIAELDEMPVHPVAVAAFDMNKTEVTVAQYRACVEDGGCSVPAHIDDEYCNYEDPDGDLHPVGCVDWQQAVEFCQWAGGRLPSEAEWEYAARSAGRDITYPWGDDAATCERAVMLDADDQNGCGAGWSLPVCSRPAGNTDQGLCDMAGNFWEWVQDYYHENYAGAPTDGSAWEWPATEHRVGRGGAFYNSALRLRASNRGFRTEARDHSYGFRCARP
jgi:iron(II)-dependent oxidoreductase